MGTLFNSGHGMYTTRLTETVNIPGYVEPSATNTMVVFPDKSSIPADGSPINVNVRAGGDYNVTLAYPGDDATQNWAYYRKYYRGLTLYADPNVENGNRALEVTLTLVADTTQTVKLKLTQSSVTDAGFCVSPGLSSVSAFGDDHVLVQLSATGSWQIDVLNDCLVVYDAENGIKYHGYNSEDFFVKVKPNYTGVERKSFVQFSGSGKAQYVVMQKPAPFSVSEDALTFEAAGGSQKITLTPITSDTLPAVTVSTLDTGFTAAYDNGVVTVTATANTASDAREGSVEIKLNDGTDKINIRLTQLGA